MKNRWILWTGIAALVIAVIIHFLVVFQMPNTIMNETMKRYGNTLSHGDPPTAKSRLTVRPAPELCYSRLAYDLGKGAMQLTAQVPENNYWSVSFYANNSDNFFVINDRQVKSNPVKILLVTSNMKYSNPDNALVVVSPTQRGVMLIRQLVPSPDSLEQVKKIQSQASIKFIEMTR